MARPKNLKVRLFVPNPGDFCRLKAIVTKGNEVQKKFIESDISAPGSQLLKFTPEGLLKPGEEAPSWLRLQVAMFYAVAKAVAREVDGAGLLKDTPSKQLTARAQQVYYTASPRIELTQQIR